MIIPDISSADQQVPEPQQLPQSEQSARSKPLVEFFEQVMALAVRLRQSSELPNAEYVVLEMINRFGPITVPQIARARATSRQNIQILIDRLETIGRVALSGNPAHKKSLLVRLTDKGRAALADSESAQKNLLVELGAQLSEVEVRGTISVLSKVRGILSAGSKDNPSDRLRQTLKPAIGKIGSGPGKLTAAKEGELQPDEFPVNLL